MSSFIIDSRNNNINMIIIIPILIILVILPTITEEPDYLPVYASRQK